MPRLQEDDAAAFDAFVVARRGSLMRTALLLTGDRGRAEDPRWEHAVAHPRAGRLTRKDGTFGTDQGASAGDRLPGGGAP